METHLAINPMGMVAPCCRYNKQNNFVNISDGYLEETFETEFLLNARNALRNGEKITGCNKCWKHEENNILSMREQFNTDRDFSILKNMSPLEKIHSLEIAFSNHCNYKCRHCNTMSSSKWKDDDIMLGRPVPDKLLLEPDISKLQLDKLVNLEHIKILGGEPLINKTHDKFILELERSGRLEQLSLEYVTNGSVFPKEEIINAWKKAKSVRIIISLDDIGDAFNYFRTDADFNVVLSNLHKFTKLSKEMNLNLGFHIVINVLNLYRFSDIIEYKLKEFPDWYFTVDRIVEPKYLRTSQWSKSIGETQINLLEEIHSNIIEKRILDSHIKRNIRKAIKIISDECVNEENNFSELFKTNDLLDNSRNTNLSDTHPIFKDYR